MSTHTPMINLLKCKIDQSESDNSIVELSDEALAHLNVMYEFAGEITQEMLLCRANSIAQWLRDTHRSYLGADVIIGDSPALVPSLVEKLKKYGFQPKVMLSCPIVDKPFPTEMQHYDLARTLVLIDM